MDELKVTRSQDISRKGVGLDRVFQSQHPDYPDMCNRDCGVSKYTAW